MSRSALLSKQPAKSSHLVSELDDKLIVDGLCSSRGNNCSSRRMQAVRVFSRTEMTSDALYHPGISVWEALELHGPKPALL